MNRTNELIIIIAVGVVITTAVFFLLREFWCWYFKLTKISSSVTSIQEILAHDHLSKFSTKKRQEPNLRQQEINSENLVQNNSQTEPERNSSMREHAAPLEYKESIELTVRQLLPDAIASFFHTKDGQKTIFQLIEKHMKYQSSWTYNKEGRVVRTCFTDVVSEGHFVNIHTDDLGNILAEHFHVDEEIYATKSNGESESQPLRGRKTDHSYNFDMVFGDGYKGNTAPMAENTDSKTDWGFVIKERFKK